MSVITVIFLVLGVFILIVSGMLAALSARFYLGRRRVDRLWAEVRHPPLEAIGAVKNLTILPLIDRKAARSDLASEPGVSYLVRADQTTILFDVGMNLRGDHPSPLLRNMQTLGVTLDQVDCIVISHLHQDHVGGIRQQWKHTFDLSGQPLDLGGKPAFVPQPMTHPTAKVEVVDNPRLLASGIASLGPIPR